MAGQPSLSLWFGGFEVGSKQAQRGPVREYRVHPAGTSAAGLFSSRGVVFAGRD